MQAFLSFFRIAVRISLKTKLMKILFLLLICFCLLNLACIQASVETVSSNAVQSAQIYQIYIVEASGARTDVVAAFRIGGATGTTLELAEPAKILYNGAAMPVSAPGNLLGTNYRMKGTDYRTFFNEYNPSHEFSFTDNDGKTFVSTVNLAGFEIAAQGAITLESSQPATIPLTRGVGADESLTIAIDTIIDDEVSLSPDSPVYLNAKRNAVIITPQYWQAKQLKPQAELKLKIKKSGNVSQGSTLGGSFSAVYSAAPVMVNVNQGKNTVAAPESNSSADLKPNNADADSAVNSKAAAVNKASKIDKDSQKAVNSIEPKPQTEIRTGNFNSAAKPKNP